MSLATDAQIAAMAAIQHGLVTTEQLRGLGLGRHYATRRVDAGTWRRLARGVFAVALMADSWRQRLHAACLSAGRGAAASHRAAGALLGLDAIPRGVVELSVPLDRAPRGTGALVHRTADPPVSTPIDGIPCTSPARTVVDLAAVLGPQRLEQAMDSAVRMQLTTFEAIAAELDELARPGRTGVARLRPLLDDRLPGVRESRLETMFLQLLRAAGLPAPVSQLELRLPSGLIRADFGYPDWGILIELDGAATHSGRVALDRDLARQNALTLDWLVLRFTWTHVTREPEYVVATIRAAIRARTALSA